MILATIMEMHLNHSELFTVAEKDEHYHRLWLEDNIQEIAQRCLGVRKWMQFRSAITILSRFGYFATCTLSDIPTPGQEYCNAQLKSCSLTQRLLMILLNNDLKLPKEVPKPIVDLVKDVHLITFYLFGDTYDLSKRATGVAHTRNGTNDQTPATGLNIINKLVGCLSLIKLILSIPQKQGEMKLSTSSDNINDSSATQAKMLICDSDTSMLCQLCSTTREQPTSTLCGHIFCWTCIHKWLRERNECPVCRMPTEPSRLIHLINFK